MENIPVGRLAVGRPHKIGTVPTIIDRLSRCPVILYYTTDIKSCINGFPHDPT